MSDLLSIVQQLRDRLEIDLLTPHQRAALEWIHHLDFPPNRVINVYGTAGVGKTFLAWMLEREEYASVFDYNTAYKPVYKHLVIDKAPTAREATRELRALPQQLGVDQLILLTRNRVDEPSMPAIELAAENEDRAKVASNLFRHLGLSVDYLETDTFVEILRKARD